MTQKKLKLYSFVFICGLLLVGSFWLYLRSHNPFYVQPVSQFSPWDYSQEVRVVEHDLMDSSETEENYDQEYNQEVSHYRVEPEFEFQGSEVAHYTKAIPDQEHIVYTVRDYYKDAPDGKGQQWTHTELLRLNPGELGVSYSLLDAVYANGGEGPACRFKVYNDQLVCTFYDYGTRDQYEPFTRVVISGDLVSEPISYTFTAPEVGGHTYYHPDDGKVYLTYAPQGSADVVNLRVYDPVTRQSTDYDLSISGHGHYRLISLAVSDVDGSIVYLTSSEGDAGSWWGNSYYYDTDTKKLVQYVDHKDLGGDAEFKNSIHPDGDQVVFYDWHDQSVYLRDLFTGVERNLFVHIPPGGDEELGTLAHFDWMDENRFVFRDYARAYVYEVDTGQIFAITDLSDMNSGGYHGIDLIKLHTADGFLPNFVYLDDRYVIAGPELYDYQRNISTEINGRRNRLLIQ